MTSRQSAPLAPDVGPCLGCRLHAGRGNIYSRHPLSKDFSSDAAIITGSILDHFRDSIIRAKPSGT